MIFRNKRIRQYTGVIIIDFHRVLWALCFKGRWVSFCNRNDRLIQNPDGPGVLCDWNDSREIHVCNIIPATANWLFRRSQQSFPIQLKNDPAYISSTSVCSDKVSQKALPDVSFVIGHRGLERLPQLLTTLRSIACQKNVVFECIVVEQDELPKIREHLPDWVQYYCCPLSDDRPVYSRAQAFNDAARKVRGKIMILHDNDMLVPSEYAAEVFRLYRLGYEVSQLKRFIFYLSQDSSELLFNSSTIGKKICCERVVENLCGGASLAISREAYWRIGGMDEDFIGWGGEDNEFWDRCQILNMWNFMYLPMVHLWHVSLANYDPESPALVLLRKKRRDSAVKRIHLLCKKGDKVCV